MQLRNNSDDVFWGFVLLVAIIIVISFALADFSCSGNPKPDPVIERLDRIERLIEEQQETKNENTN